jgi:predicted ATPase
MRLKSVYISQYKNLTNFTLNFDGNSFIDVFVGKNGTGKSNLFEALIEIFRHIYEYNKNKEELAFDYSITFVINGKETKIDYISGKLKINGESRTTIRKNLLPDNVLIYYSGHNNTVANLVKKYEDKFRYRIKNASFGESRPFIGIGSEYKELLLSVLLMQPQDNKAQQYICQKLTIQQIGLEVKLILQRPAYAEKNSSFDIEINDESDRYWKAEGITKTFLDRLSNCISKVSGNRVRDEGYFPNDDQYILYFDIAQIQQKFSNFTSQDLFQEFDNLKTLNMLKEISIPLTLEDGEDATISYFSDGQFQSVYIYSIIEIFKDRNCITLLDEPDSFLHPEWQFEFLKQIFEITDTTSQKNHVLMSSHSAMTLTPLPKTHLKVFEVLDNTVKVNSFNKEEIIKLLSGNRIFLTENESIISISTYLKKTSEPVLFTEGISDEYILETAWKKLFQGSPRPFCIHNAFDHIFLKSLFSRDELRKNFPERAMFALFDFDEAYNSWNGLKGIDEITDPSKGLIKKLDSTNHYAMLLPVPRDNEIKKQVLNSNDKPWQNGSGCYLPIELLFYKANLIGSWFEKQDISGGGKRIVFKGDKVKFAQEYVAKLDQASFEIFRPIFDFIKLKC